MSINPFHAARAIQDSYISYLSSTFSFMDRALQEEFTRLLNQPGRLIKGPILEATPEFARGKTISEMVDTGVLSKSLLKLSAISPEMILYKHQEEAITKLLVKRRNLVVATGTGSGKTEAFLLPIVSDLLQEYEQGSLDPGVRALLLYPMNALANDQVKRLRNLLKDCPQITFGRYIGETLERKNDALEHYRKVFSCDPLENELISREEMRNSPPHILLTNYAMLEYLLLRPKDTVFFDGSLARHWRYLVVDEAHTFSGARGIEMAMLIRRLKERIFASEDEHLQCVATSATLGNGRHDAPAVVAFASRLFGESFEWEEDNQDRQDVVYATRLPIISTEDAFEGWEYDSDLYLNWYQTILSQETTDVLNDLARISRQAGLPELVIQQAVTAAQKNGWPAFLYRLLKHDLRVINLQKKLQESPCLLEEVAKELFSDDPEQMEKVVALVDIAKIARPEPSLQSLIPARYHLFVRAVEGVYQQLEPKPRLFLERRNFVEEKGHRYPVFELAACRNCGATYLVGTLINNELPAKLQPPRMDDEYQVSYFYLLGKAVTEEELDEDDETVLTAQTYLDCKQNRLVICGKCGTIDLANTVLPPCDCGPEHYQYLLEVPGNEEGRVITCLACGKRSIAGMVWRFLTGTDATASVLATALYQQLDQEKPEYTSLREEISVSASTDDGWESAPEDAMNISVNKEPPRLLIFSDSRQDAAFFAPYLDRTYSQILRRVLILKTLETSRSDILTYGWRLSDLARALAEQARRSGFFIERETPQEQFNEVWRWVMFEFLGLDNHINLEGLGLMGFTLLKPEDWSPFPALTRPPWNLSSDEVWMLFQILINSLRRQGAILFPENVSPRDELFQPRNREIAVRSHSNTQVAKLGIIGWNPRHLNSRLDYLHRLSARLEGHPTPEDCRLALEKIWEKNFRLGQHTNDYFAEVTINRDITARQLRYEMWELQPTLVKPDIQWYRCDRCRSLTLYNLREVCPNYRCSGKLVPCEPYEVLRDNHYYRLYTELTSRRMIVREHTAQLTSEAAADLQVKFNNGQVNVLSCSTTFELGVDVGELEAVLLRNVPPSAANYVQRAGRAGRRVESTAFVLTYAQRRSHDLDHFRNPLNMVAGKIGVPHVQLQNPKIILRHVNAVALASFWRQYPDYFEQVQGFFFAPDISGPDLFLEYLKEHPSELLDSLQRIVPLDMQPILGIEDWSWIKHLFGDSGVLKRAEDEVVNDVTELENLRHKRFESNQGGVDHLSRLIKTIKERNLINFLSSRNVLPKYGFPVDVVELNIINHSEEARMIELERDLRIALSEYAPGSEVVAAGKLWTSRYIKLPPGKQWDTYDYAICKYCHNFYPQRAEFEDKLQKCPVCDRSFGNNQGTFIIPDFGFISSPDPPQRPREKKPERTYSMRVFFSPGNPSAEPKSIFLKYPHIRIKATAQSQGKLVVINKGSSGFRVCPYCGFASMGTEKVPSAHQTPWGQKCSGTLRKRYSLGHQFYSDILRINFQGYQNTDSGFWLSLLYGLLEGASSVLDIERQDLDGCIYRPSGGLYSPELVLFDDVPGGAGHVYRIAEPNVLEAILERTREKLEVCECGGKEGDASCQGCLRNYRNQFCHEDLKRGPVIQFLSQLRDC
ncbi:MAG TPA: DEAD/DEAH box helicase [Syntrophomonas sp.]|nr:DEAD/DEAH box helicase [Syntrophomonas sp.]